MFLNLLILFKGWNILKIKKNIWEIRTQKERVVKYIHES